MEKLNVTEKYISEYCNREKESDVSYIKDVFKNVIKEVNAENQENLNRMEYKKIQQMSKQAFEENKKYEDLIKHLEKQKFNSRNKSLDVYRTYKDVRSYLYILTTHLNKHAKYIIAKPLLDDLFEAMKYLSLYVNSNNAKEKRSYLEKFIAFHDNLIDKIEFCVEIKSVSFKQASRIISLLITLEPQISELRETLN